MIEVQGFCAPAFQAVRAAFEHNFAEHGERGAAVAVRHEGEVVVDLWGGAADRAGRPWEEDTLAVVFSSTKGLAALCMHILIDRGLIDVGAPVAR